MSHTFENLAALAPEAVEMLNSMYAGEPQLGLDGQLHAIDPTTSISREAGAFLYSLHQAVRPTLSVEVGMAYGFSTIYMLSAMKQGGYGQHIAIDYSECGHWHGIGVQNVTKLGMSGRFRLIQSTSTAGLPQLACANTKAQFIFIDGNHRFDDVLVDFYLANFICEVGGLMLFDDTLMPSVEMVVNFIASNRADYAPIHCTVPNLGVFQKVGEDTRDWRHYVAF